MSTTAETTPYRAAIEHRNVLRESIKSTEKQHAELMQSLRAALTEQERLIGIAEAGVPIEQFQTARQFVSIEWGGREYESHTRERTGPRRDTPEVHSCFREAIEEFRGGPKFILTRYFGVKEYDRWNSQREDHKYGYGPKHGGIWFRIEMPDAMRREIRDGGRVMTDEETIAVVAWLTAVESNPALLDAGIAR